MSAQHLLNREHVRQDERISLPDARPFSLAASSVLLLFHLRCITAIVLQEAEADLTPYLRFHAIPGLAFCLNLLNHSGPAP